MKPIPLLLTLAAGCLCPGLQAELLDVPASASNSLRGGNYVDTVYSTSMSASARGSAPRKGIMKFDMSVVSLEEGTAGTLKITILEAPAALTVATMDVGVYALPTTFVPGPGIQGYNWDPAITTWNNAPGNLVDSVTSFSSEMDRVGTLPVKRADLAGTQYTVAIENIAKYLQPDNTITFGLAYELVDLYYMKFGAWNEDPSSYKPYIAVNGTPQNVPWGPGYMINPFTGIVDTGDFIGWLAAAEEPWIYSYSLSSYLYFYESYLSASGGWMYVLESDFAKFQYYPAGGGYGWSYQLSAWVYSDSAASGGSGAGWLYVFN